MLNFRELVFAEYGAEGSGCQGHVVHNTVKSVEDHEVFKDVKQYSTELYSELCAVKGTKLVGRPVSYNSLEWPGEFTKAQNCIDNGEIILDFMVNTRFTKYFPIEVRGKRLRD